MHGFARRNLSGPARRAVPRTLPFAHEARQARMGALTAHQLWSELQEKLSEGHVPPPKRFTEIMRRATKAHSEVAVEWPARDVELAEQVFRRALHFYGTNNYVWAEMIACCTRAKRTDVAERVYREWRAMREASGMDGGLLPMEAMIAHYAHAHQLQAMAGVYEDIRAANLVPSAYSTSTLAKSFCLFGETEKALQLLVHTQPGQDSWHLTNAIMNELCKEGKVDEAVLVLNDSSKLGFPPTRETFNNLLRAAAQAGQHIAMDAILQKMRDTGLETTQQTWRFILLGYAYAPDNVDLDARLVHDLWRKVQALGEPIDPRTASAAMLAYLRLDDANNVMSILKPRYQAEPITFSVWERFLALYYDQFRRSRRLKESQGLAGREQALMKVYAMMRANFELYAKHASSQYDTFRWRKLHMAVLSKLKNPDNVERVFNDVQNNGFFMHPDEQHPEAAASRRDALAAMLQLRLNALQYLECVPLLKMEPTLVRLVNQHLTRVVREGSAAERAKHVPKYVQLMAALPELAEVESSAEVERVLRSRSPEAHD